MGAKARLARLEAAGGIKALLSPSPSGAAAASSAPAFSPGQFNHGASSSGGSRLSGEEVVSQGGGLNAGEYSLMGGMPGGLPVFLVMPESLVDMCCGAVAGEGSSSAL